MNNNKRVITNVYIVQVIGGGDIVKVCSNMELAEYYRSLLSPKYIELFDVSLTVNEYPLVHFKTERIKINEEEYIEVIQENLDALKKLETIKQIIN